MFRKIYRKAAEVAKGRREGERERGREGGLLGNQMKMRAGCPLFLKVTGGPPVPLF